MIVDYFMPDTMEEILRLAIAHPHARIIAGGTEAFRQAADAPGDHCCIDISRIPSLAKIEITADTISIGAAVRIAQLEHSPEIQSECQALIDATVQFASPQIRNQGTVVGNLCTGRAVAAFSMAAQALGAQIEFHDEGQVLTRELSPQAIRSTTSTRRLVTALRIPRSQQSRGSAYTFVGGRATFSFPMVAVAVSLEVRGGSLTNVRSLVSPTLAAPVPGNAPPCAGCGGVCRLCISRLMEDLDDSLEGREANPEAVVRALDDLDWSAVHVRESALYGSVSYRRQVMKELLKRSFDKALRRAEGHGRSSNG